MKAKTRLTVLYQNNVRHTEPLVRDAEEANADIIGVNHRRIPAYLPESFGSYQLFHQEGDAEKSFILTRKAPLRAGKLRLTAERTASFLTFEEGGRNLIFVNVNFAGLTGSEGENCFWQPGRICSQSGRAADYRRRFRNSRLVGNFSNIFGSDRTGSKKPHHHERRQQPGSTCLRCPASMFWVIAASDWKILTFCRRTKAAVRSVST